MERLAVEKPPRRCVGREANLRPVTGGSPGGLCRVSGAPKRSLSGLPLTDLTACRCRSTSWKMRWKVLDRLDAHVFKRWLLVASLLLVAMPGATSSFSLLVASLDEVLKGLFIRVE